MYILEFTEIWGSLKKAKKQKEAKKNIEKYTVLFMPTAWIKVFMCQLRYIYVQYIHIYNIHILFNYKCGGGLVKIGEG